MKNQAQKVNFQFSLKLTLFVIVMMPILISLGIWQIDRGNEKEAMQAQLAKQFEREPLNICDITTSQHSKKFLQYLPVTLTAEMTEKNFLIDNKTYKGKVGYEVIQLVQSCGREYLISRGFVEGNPDRRILPSIESYVAEIKKLSGYIYLPINNQFVRDEIFPEIAVWPLRISQINFEKMANYVHDELDLFPAIIRLTSDDGVLYEEHWTLLAMKPAKHYAYAIQWFGLALTLLCMYLYSSLKKTNRNLKQ